MTAPRRILAAGRKVEVRVPATSANLGPGFDCLGLALDWIDRASIEVIDEGCRVEVRGEGAGSLPTDRSHLLISCLDLGLTDLGVEAPGVRLSAVNTIPHTRGLGSSAAATVAGLAAAWALARPDQELDREWLLQLATAVEGHADNVAAAIYGGFVICVGSGLGGDRVRAITAPVHPELGAVAYVPTGPVSTKSARELIPASIPHADAVANSAHAALLVHALRAEPGLLGEATADWLHQRYRTGLMPGSARLLDQLRGRGLAAVISGSGPTVLVLGTRRRLDELLDELQGSEAEGFAFFRLGVGPGVQVTN